MNEQQFAYWLQGFAELTGDTPPTEAQWKSIREHLALVFHKVTPKVTGGPGPAIASPAREGAETYEDIFKKYMEGRGIGPAPTPYQPYFLDQGVKPGTIIC